MHSSGFYTLHVSDPSLLQKFRNGKIGGTRTEGLLLDLSEGDKYVGSAKMIASTTDVVTSAFQAATFVVAQSHLNAVARSLDGINLRLLTSNLIDSSKILLLC